MVMYQRLEVHERGEMPIGTSPGAILVLGFDDRQKSRLLATSQEGRDVGIFLERGDSLKHGDVLRATNGEWVRVMAADEPLSEVVCHDAWMLARAAYHLGNRHVPLQVLPTALRYQRDYVLDDMVRQLGLQVRPINAGFQPEQGAYHHGHTPVGASVFRAPSVVLAGTRE